MFTGIVETIGTIVETHSVDGCQHYTIQAQQHFLDLILGESISVNGVCLTVIAFTNDSFTIAAVPETLRLTNLGQLHKNSFVNLERSMQLNSRMGGHYVQGHVDGTGELIDIKPDQSSALIAKIKLPKHLIKYVVPKGYITIDGMSITVIQTQDNWFTVTFIPHTQAVTITKFYSEGCLLNIEVDIMGKYIEKLMGAYAHA